MSPSQERQPTLDSIAPRFPVGDLSQALAFYAQLGFATTYRDGEFAIVERDGISLHFTVSEVHGHSSFEWLMEGALLVWHFDWERGGPPSARSVIGHDDTVETCSMLYTDERGVARIYQMSLEGGVWKMWRDSPGFSQRMTGTFSGDGNTITCHGELSRDGSHWEQDLDVTYTRKQ